MQWKEGKPRNTAHSLKHRQVPLNPLDAIWMRSICRDLDGTVVSFAHWFTARSVTFFWRFRIEALKDEMQREEKSTKQTKVQSVGCGDLAESLWPNPARKAVNKKNHGRHEL